MLLASPDLDQAGIEDALRQILESQFFRSSAQCSALFRYIVENTVLGRDEWLRERVIGSEVFDRPPDYDTGSDHIVRSRASEVRKRLAQFYQESRPDSGIRISIPTGSYRATFEAMHPPEAVSADHLPFEGVQREPDLVPLHPETVSVDLGRIVHASSFGFRRWLYAGLCLVACLIALLATHRYIALPSSGYELFWSPLIQNPKPALIYCGGGFVYKLSDQYLDDYRRQHELKSARREFFVDLKKGESLDGADLIPDRHFVPFGDLASTASVVSTLTLFHKSYDLRYGEDVAFTELRSSPVILIGGLNNNWALRATRNLRFVLDEDDRITDRSQKDRRWVQQADADNLTRDDYAIISRLPQSEAGGFMLSIAGIRMYGTRAAADLISDKAALNRILKDAPKGWQLKNMQIVIHTRVVNEIPVSLAVEAVNYW